MSIHRDMTPVTTPSPNRSPNLAQLLIERSTIHQIVRGNSIVDNLQNLDAVSTNAALSTHDCSNECDDEPLSVIDLIQPLFDVSKPIDEEYMRTILLAYPYMIEPHKLLYHLFVNYYTNEKNPNEDPESETALERKRRVIDVLKMWLGLSPEQFKKDTRMSVLLANWHALLLKEKDVGTPRTVSSNSLMSSTSSNSSYGKDSNAQQLFAIWDAPKQIYSDLSPSVYRNIGPREQRMIQKYKRHELFDKTSIWYFACQWTVADYDLYSQVSITDLLCKNWEINKDSALVAVRDHFNKMIQWIATTVLEHKSTKLRTQCITKFIRIGECMVKLNNLNGLMTIGRALTLPCIHRLEKTWKGLAPEDRVVWSNISAIISPAGQYGVYRNLVKSATGCVVPCFYILLQQIEDLENAAILADGKYHLSKLKSLASLLYPFKKSQRIPYNIAKDMKVQKFIRDEVELISMERLSDISRKLEESSEDNVDVGVNPLERQKWFFGTATRPEAESILQTYPHNAFLVRQSSNPGSYIISHWNFKLKKSSHSLVNQTVHGGLYIQGGVGIYENIFTLIETCPELAGYDIAWNETAKEVKKRHNLPLPHEEADATMHNRMLRTKTTAFCPSSGTRFMSYNRYAYTDTFASTTLGMTQPVDRKRAAEMALETGDLLTLIDLIKEGLPVNTLFTDGKTLFHIAAENNNARLVDFVMEFSNQNKPDLDVRDAWGWTALHHGAVGGHLSVCSALLRHNAPVNVVNNSGATPLHYFSRITTEDPEYLDILEEMIRRNVNVNSQDINHETPLHQAVKSKNIAATRDLIEHGAFVDTPNKNGHTPLDLALQEKDEALINLLKAKMESHLQEHKHSHDSHKHSHNSHNGKHKVDDLELPAHHHGDLLLRGEGFIIDNGRPGVDFQVEASKLKLEDVGTPYKTYFEKTPHHVLVGKDIEWGVVFIFLIIDSPKCRLLIRTKQFDEMMKLPTISEPQAFVASIKLFFESEFKEREAVGNATTLFMELESRLAVMDVSLGLLHVKEGQYTEDSIMRDGIRSKGMEEWAVFLGKKVPARGLQGERSLRQLHQNGNFLAPFSGDPSEFAIYSQYRENHGALFHVSSGTPEESRRKVMQSQSVVVAFLDEGTTCFDTSILKDTDCNAVFVVKPILIENKKYCRLSIARKVHVRRWGPELPFPAIFPMGDKFRQFLLVKLINATFVARSAAAQKEWEESRDKDLTWAFWDQKKSNRGNGKDVKEEYTGRDIYKLGEEVGRGATGIARLAVHRISRKKFCMKIINKDELRSDQRLLDSVMYEVRLLEKLRHPNIVKFVEKFETNREQLIVMELCEGGSLEDDVKKNQQYTEIQAAPIIYQLLDAVNYMHSKGISHRDLKPANLLFVDKTRKSLRIADFGFSKDVRNQTMSHSIAGTPDYVAPEVLDGKEYDYFGIDMWSCGCIAYFMLYGHPPFMSSSMNELYQMITSGKVNYSHPLVKVTPAAEAFIKRMLCLNMSSRATAAEALEDPWLLDGLNSIIMSTELPK